MKLFSWRGYWNAKAFFKRQLNRLARHKARRKAARAEIRRARALFAAANNWRRRKRAVAVLDGTSWRQLKRSVACGRAIPQPTLEAALRHQWAQRIALAAALRVKAGQGSAEDRAFSVAVASIFAKKRKAA